MEEPSVSKKMHHAGKDGRFKCNFCNKSFTQQKNCNRHKMNCKNNSDGAVVKFSCPKCSVSYSRSDHLKVHVARCQRTCDSYNDDARSSAQKTKTPCLVSHCKEEFFHKIRLIEHLKFSHNDIQIKEPVELSFKSAEKFLKWKEEEEEKTFSYFSLKKGQTQGLNTYYCQHDGAAKVHAARKTSRCNRKGRVKIGHFCIAHMKVAKAADGLIQVTYYPTHSHQCSPQGFLHHPLSKDLSGFIDRQIGEEVSPSKIFSKVKNMYISSDCEDIQTEKINILTKKRIRERARRQRMARRLHEDDAKSVFLMAKDMATKDDSILIYKPYGADVIIGPVEVNNLPFATEIFMFGFQTRRQLQLMEEHGAKIMIVDETHGTNQYCYQLLTCMVVDDNRRGWPVAHLITNKSDAATLKFFFECLKSKSNTLCINCVITDDDSALINGITDGFSSSIRHILCRWHVFKNLKENLRGKVSKDLFDDMVSEIRVMMNVIEEQLFKDLCRGFLKKYEEDEKAVKFISYFKQHYLNRTEKWAMCFRKFPHAEVNTTGHVESFHNKFKKMYLKRKVNKRLDDLIVMLQNLEWEDHCTRQREALVGFSPITEHAGERHHKSLSILDEYITEILANTWEIKSQTKTNEVYVIVCYTSTCFSDFCFLKCTHTQCNGLCSHLYSCSCPDQHPLCKHIHKLHSFLHRGQSCSSDSDFYNLESSQNNEDRQQGRGDEEFNETRSVVHRKYDSLLAKIGTNLATLKNFQENARVNNVSDQTLKHVNYVLTNLVHHIKQTEDTSQLNVVGHMIPQVNFNSQEKLKTQLSQLSSFKRPFGKRKRKIMTDNIERKKSVVKNLLDFLPPDTFLLRKENGN